MASNLISSSAEKSPKEKLTAEEIQEYALLLENSFTLGYLSEPAKRTVSNAARMQNRQSGTACFLCMTAREKKLCFRKRFSGCALRKKKRLLLSQVTIGGVQVLRAESKSGATYWAEHGKCAVSAGERSVMEEILSRSMEKFPERQLWRNRRVSGSASEPGRRLGRIFSAHSRPGKLAADSKTGNSPGPSASRRCQARRHALSQRPHLVRRRENTRAGGDPGRCCYRNAI